MSMNRSRLRSMPKTQNTLDIFSMALNCSPSPMRIFRLSDGVTVDINKSYERALQYAREEIIGSNPINLGIWFECDLDPKIIPWLIENKGNISNLRASLRKKDNTVITATISVKMVEVMQEKFGVLAFEDISLRKSFEESLRQSERRFYNVFNNNPDPLVILDISTLTILEENTSFERLSGYTRVEIIGMKASNLITNVRMLRRLERDMISLGKVENKEVEVSKKSGEMAVMLLSMEVIEFAGRQCYLCSARDITDMRKMGRDLARLERFNLIGQMSASIGHEIRNPMTTIKGFLQLLGNQEQDEKKKSYYDIMINEVERANSIISEFLDLAHDKAKRLEMGDINLVLRSIHPLLISDTNKQEKMLVMDLNEIPKLMIDDKEIRQLVYNLFNNGLEAMEKGGLLTISTYTENGQVVLMLQDTGCGIDPSLQEKVGNPFFTTKEFGTGLGLAVCYSIANRHNAKMDFSSDNTGTTFYIRFPIPTLEKMC